jgi:hypothetical protein
MGRAKRKVRFPFQVPEGHVQKAVAVEHWRRLWMRHLAAGQRGCALGQLAQEVFSGDVWSGGQTSWRSEAEVYR